MNQSTVTIWQAERGHRWGDESRGGARGSEAGRPRVGELLGIVPPLPKREIEVEVRLAAEAVS